MWPKNLAIYRFNRALEFPADELERCLSEFAFKPCGATEVSKLGWVSVLGRDSELFTHEVGGNVVIRACSEKKRVPPAVLRDRLNSRVKEIESETGQPVKARERSDIKEAIMKELLPRVFPQSTYVNVYIFRELGFVMVDTSSWKSAEDYLSLLRKSLGTLPVVPVIPLKAIESTLTEWVSESAPPAGYEMTGTVELTSVIDGQSVLRGVNQDMRSEKLISHLEAAQVTKLGFDWQERLSCALTSDGMLKGVKWSENIRDQNDDIPKEDVLARMDSDYALIFGELSAFVPNLYEMLGGYTEE